MSGPSFSHLNNRLTVADVRRALRRPLPGFAAQCRMAPAYPTEALRDRKAPANPKLAGVLILFYPGQRQLLFPLTVRTESVQYHKGQVSLPGGAKEPDETVEEAATRETREELGVHPDSWQMLGQLTPLFIPPSGFLITPFVAYSDQAYRFRPDPTEVGEVIETPLRRLLDPRTVASEEWVLRGIPVTVPYFHIQGHKVWGATAMVLSELVALMWEERN